ncbi:MAG: hypothetical protein KIT27_06720 [Legionellales bacterium]|nr:hypothetical protein [Legionellales bacterium]
MQKNPHKIYTLALSYVTAKVILLAGEYKLDKLIPSTGISTLELATTLQFNHDALKRFLRVLEAHEIVLISQDRVYCTELTPQLARARSPHLIRAYEAFEEFEFTLKTHEPAWNKKFGKIILIVTIEL